MLGHWSLVYLIFPTHCWQNTLWQGPLHLKTLSTISKQIVHSNYSNALRLCMWLYGLKLRGTSEASINYLLKIDKNTTFTLIILEPSNHS